MELRYFQPVAEGDQLRAVIAEAFQALPPEPTVNQVVAWVNENKGMEVEPVSVGMQVRALGYRTERVFRDGKLWRVIQENS